jgi:hypothetical protein
VTVLADLEEDEMQVAVGLLAVERDGRGDGEDVALEGKARVREARGTGYARGTETEFSLLATPASREGSRRCGDTKALERKGL